MERVKISFQLKTSKLSNSGEAPIYTRITINNQRAEFTTKQFVHPNKWDKYRHEVKGRSEYARTTNNTLAELKANILQTFNLVAQKDGKVTTKFLNTCLKYGLQYLM